MSVASMEYPCEQCLRATLHKPTRRGLACIRCGSLAAEAEEQRRNVQRWTTPHDCPLPPLRLATSGTSTSDERSPDHQESIPREEGGPHRFSAATEADRWDADPSYAAVVLSLAGLSIETGSEQHASIGGEEVWARVWIDRRGSYVIRFRTQVRGRRSLCLTEIYAMQRARVWWRLGKPEQARWQIAALAESGKVPLPPTRLRPLPTDAPRIVVTLWPFVAELVAVRRVREPEERTLPLSSPIPRQMVPP